MNDLFRIPVHQIWQHQRLIRLWRCTDVAICRRHLHLPIPVSYSQWQTQRWSVQAHPELELKPK